MQQDTDSGKASSRRIISGGSRTSSEIPTRPSNENIFSSRSAKSNDQFCPIPSESARRLTITRWAPIPLRLIVGYGFVVHGFAKLARGPGSFATILHAIGIPAPYFMVWTTILTEVLGGTAIILGAFTALVSLPMAVLLLVAIFTVHLPYGFSSIKLIAVTSAGAQFGPPGYECDLLYLACLATLVFGGSGPLAIDGLIRRRRKDESIYGERLQ